ncbi:MAG: Verru_Chthon cassette protein A [Roseimicrobium sp.]
MLTLLVALIIAFLSLVRTERAGSSIFAESVEVRNLSNVPVSLVISQLRKATENNAPRDGSKNFKSWASQPGMIRQYGVEPDESGFRSKPVALYKLYSDDAMVISKNGATAGGGGLSAAEVSSAMQADTEPLANWDKKPGLYTDLNEPVAVPGTTPAMKFPIADPRAVVAGPGGHAVDGFDYVTQSNATYPKAATVAGTMRAKARDDIAARLPMPVRWLYMLRDGTLISPSSGDEEKTTFTGGEEQPMPTLENPIVGRVAFWTDDDCAKININTAAEGTHWDMPVATGQTEKDYATRMPAQNEYSRYPGHPAATSLSTVFQAFSADYYVDPTRPADAAVHERLHKLSPRTPWGGSKAGTQTPGSSKTGIPAKTERLYASVDEMFFDPNRDPANTNVSDDALDLGRFFLTAHSRAPEMNLFGKPRISLWPQSADTKQRNPKDKLLAFLSETTGSVDRQWYWMREKNWSASDPGSSQSSTMDYPGTKRNDSMFDAYYRYLVGEGGYLAPGFANRTLTTKYGAAKRNQIGAELFDLLRCGVNGYSSVSEEGWPTYTYLPDRINGNKGQSSAVPLRISTSRGFGRWPTVTEAVIVFARVKDGDREKMQAYILLETFVPSSGPPCMTPNIVYRITGMDGFKVAFGSANAVTMGFGGAMDNICPVTEGTFGMLACGNAPFTGLGNQLAAGGTAKVPTPGNGGNVAVYPFVSTAIEIPAGAQDFQFTGGDFTIETYPGWQLPPTDLVQTIRMTLPNVRLKVPRMNPTYQTLDSRFTKDSTRYEAKLIVDGDTVRSVEADVNAAPKGDLRLYSLMKEVPKTWFTVHPDYGNLQVERRQFLRTDFTASNGQFGPHAGALPAGQNWGEQSNRQSNHNTAGTLVRNFIYARGCPPAVPRGLNGAFLNVGSGSAGDDRPGDWDNGVGIIADGPYMRKPDEGNSGTNGDAYLTRHYFDKETGVTYSPNRQIASAISFGSLPTGIDINSTATVKPWQTLLFCPNPASRSAKALEEPTAKDHPGFGTPRDHLMLDLFWMPITEPYAISEPLSTGGKINLNTQIVPFTHIERSTGVRAVLKSARVTAITPDSAGGAGSGVDASSSGSGRPYVKSGADVYKQSDDSTTHKFELRYAVNGDATMEGIRDRFNKWDIYRSASEICEIFLVPQRLQGKNYGSAAPPPTKYKDMMEWWNGNLSDLTRLDAFELTGDNSREMPYNHIYPRLTTQSNTFTVHYRVQTLKKARSTTPDVWEEAKDSVSSEFRGSTTLERYLDPNDKEVGPANIGSSTFTTSWDTFYRIRIIQRNQFVP